MSSPQSPRSECVNVSEAAEAAPGEARDVTTGYEPLVNDNRLRALGESLNVVSEAAEVVVPRESPGPARRERVREGDREREKEREGGKETQREIKRERQKERQRDRGREGERERESRTCSNSQCHIGCSKLMRRTVPRVVQC